MLEKDKSQVHALFHGTTPLHIAANDDHDECVRVLVLCVSRQAAQEVLCELGQHTVWRISEDKVYQSCFQSLLRNPCPFSVSSTYVLVSLCFCASVSVFSRLSPSASDSSFLLSLFFFPIPVLSFFVYPSFCSFSSHSSLHAPPHFSLLSSLLFPSDLRELKLRLNPVAYRSV